MIRSLRLSDKPDFGNRAACGNSTFRKPVPAQPVDATPPGINLFLKGGVRDAETMEAVFGPTGRYVEPLEGWTVVKCDWSGARQKPCGHSVFVGAPWWHCSPCSSPFAASTHLGRTRRHLPRNCQRQLDAGHRPRSASRLLHSKPRGSPPWWAHAVSCQRSRSAGLGVSRAAQAVSAGHAQRAATDGCE